MKTLVIHPSDPTTDFLKVIYQDKDWTIINSTVSKKVLKESIKSHDRIVMLGHGTEKGLANSNWDGVITSELVYLLREKLCVAIWCNANVFFEKYDLKGFYTGMIISEYDEAIHCCINTTYQEIEESNLLFASSIAEAIDSEDMIAVAKNAYISDGLNRTMDYNDKNLFYR